MRKLFLLLVLSIFFTLFLLSKNSFADVQTSCCCKDVCDCSGKTCNVGSPCTEIEGEECPLGYVPCYSVFCKTCTNPSHCNAVDSDGGVNIYKKGTCHWMSCGSDNKCIDVSSQTDSCIGSDSVYELWPQTDIPNYCKGERKYCPSGYKCSDGACVEIGARVGDYCDGGEQEAGSTKETTCIPGLKCCDECNKCFETCPNDLCCDSDDDCSENLPYCNLTTNKCQKECTRSGYTSCEEAIKGRVYEAYCELILSGCLYKTDKKYYNVTDAAGKEVNVTVTHYGTDCIKNDLYVYDSSCKKLGESTGRKEKDSWKGESDTDIVVEIVGDSTNENCKFDLEVECKDVCPESNSKCTGPFDVIEAGIVEALEGCLYSHDSKFYLIKETKGRKVEVKVTHSGGKDCEENNDIIIYDTCSKEITRIENQTVEKWVGTNFANDIEIKIHSDSDNKNCLWKLEISYVSEKCIDICTAGDGTNCSPFKCIDGVCSNRCDKTCNAECEEDDDCEQGEFCSSTCACVKGIKRIVELKKDWNLISQPFKEFYIDIGDCKIEKIYSYNPTGDVPYKVLQSLDETKGGYGYWIKVKNDCKITFIGTQPVTEIEMEVGWNMVGTTNNEEITVSEIKDECPDLKKVYRYVGGDGLPYERVTDKLYPGIGYWIKVESSCTIQ